MAQRIFTKDTMLDLAVNVIPLGILAFFIGLFMVWGPFSWDPLYSTLMLGIVGGSFVLLTILTYVSAIAIEGDENAREAAEAEATGREDAGEETAMADGPAEPHDVDADDDAHE